MGFSGDGVMRETARKSKHIVKIIPC